MNCLEKKIKNTELVTVKELFSDTKYGQNCFRIPDYQRGYAWSEEFIDLWKDILRVFNDGESLKAHYTGMLSLEEMNNNAREKESLSGKNAFYVVDGQQRLTSIVIIIEALLEYILEESGEDLSDGLLKLKDGCYRFDYSVDRKDGTKQFFTNRIYLGDKNNSCADMYLKNIDTAKEYLDKSLIVFDLQEAKHLLDIVLNKLVFNIYFIVEGFDVRVTFETMNNRGKKLSNLELLKNRLMYLTTFIGKEITGNSNFENSLKNLINNTWNNIYTNLCYKEYQLNDDEFLQAHWIVYGSLDKSKGDSYIKDILNYWFAIDEGTFYGLTKEHKYQDAFQLIKEYVESLGFYSKYWGIINNPNERSELIDNKEEAKWLDRLNRIISMKFVKSTVMVLAGDRYLTSQQKTDAYLLLEQSIFINKLVAQSKNDYSAIIKDARLLLKSDNHEKASAYFSLMQTLKNSEIAVSPETIDTAIVKFGLYINDKHNFYYDWDARTYFLYEYNDTLQLDSNTKMVDWKGIGSGSIEHILPQTPNRDYWRIVLRPLCDDEVLIRKFTNSLGNLLLLSKGENSSVQNFSFPTKKTVNVSSNKFAYIYGSRSAQEVATVYSYWTPHSIYLRQEKLVEFMYKRWFAKIDESMNLDLFLNKFLQNNLLVRDVVDISDKEKEELDALDLTQERNVEQQVREDKNKDWFSAIKSFFNLGTYSVTKNSKNVAYVDGRFTFTKKGDRWRCGYKSNDVSYKFDYDASNGILSVNTYSNDEWLLLSDLTLMPKEVQYFIRTFNRALKRYFNKSEVIIYDNSNLESDDEKSKAKRMSEDEYMRKRIDNQEMISLYRTLKNKINAQFPNAEEYCTNNYIAFFTTKNFAEIHIFKDCIRINIRDINCSSDLGKRLPDSYNWTLRYQFTINTSNQIGEAIKLISMSYHVVEDSK